MLAECEKASRVPDRVLMATALTSVIKEAEELRLYARPKDWLTWRSGLNWSGRERAGTNHKEKRAKRIDLMLATDNLGFLQV